LYIETNTNQSDNLDGLHMTSDAKS